MMDHGVPLDCKRVVEFEQKSFGMNIAFFLSYNFRPHPGYQRLVETWFMD